MEKWFTIYPMPGGGAIIQCLYDGPRGTTDLLKDIQPLTGGTTKQGFYGTLRRLKALDTVVIYKKQVALNTTWIRRMQETFSRIERAYLPTKEQSGVLSLSD